MHRPFGSEASYSLRRPVTINTLVYAPLAAAAASRSYDAPRAESLQERLCYNYYQDGYILREHLSDEEITKISASAVIEAVKLIDRSLDLNVKRGKEPPKRHPPYNDRRPPDPTPPPAQLRALVFREPLTWYLCLLRIGKER